MSGFVAAHLRPISDAPIDLESTYAAILAEQYPDGGWGYGGAVPADADSTAWCVAALAGEQGAGEAVASGRLALADHRRDDGYATFRPDSGIDEFIGATSAEAVSGWTAPHVDVTAAVVLAGVPDPADDEDAEDVLAALAGAQKGSGFVDSYWWRGPLYGTALVLRALHGRQRRLTDEQEGVMYRGLTRVQLPEGGFALAARPEPDPFTTALGLEALARLRHLDGARSADRAAAALLAAQRPEGSWQGDFVLRIPAPDVRDPRLVDEWSLGTGGGNSLVPDTDGIFATTLACHALDLWASGWAPDPTDFEVVEPPPPSGDMEVVMRRQED